MIAALLLLVFSQAHAYFGEPLPIKNLMVKELRVKASCSMLLHRKRERAKVLRERLYMDQSKTDDPVRALLLKNQFMINQYFIDDRSLMTDQIQVSFSAPLTPELKTRLLESGLAGIFISLKGPGLLWSSMGDQLPQGLNIEWNRIEDQLLVRYPIHQADWCNTSDIKPKFSWLSSDQDIGAAFDTYEWLQALGALTAMDSEI